MKIKTIEMAEMQKGIYFDCQIEQTTSYHISASVLLEHVDERCLENAFKILVHHQESLRSAFEMEDGLPVMHIYDNGDYELRKEDISAQEDQSVKIEEITKEIISAPFELSKASLFRAALVKTAQDRHILILCCHHLIADGLSMGIMVDQLLKHHQSLLTGEKIQIYTDHGFSDFIVSENHKLSIGGYEVHKNFWKNKLKDAEALEIQTDYANENWKINTGKVKQFLLSDELFHRIGQLSKDHEVTMFTFFLAAFQLLMSKYSRKEDIIVSSPFTYRPDFNLEETIGCFVHMLPIRSKIKAADTFGDTLQGVQNDFIQAYKNIGYPNNLIMRDSFPAIGPGQPSIYDISFVYDFYDEMESGELKAIIMDQAYETFSGNMMVVLNHLPEKNQIKILYQPELYGEETIEYLGRRYLKLLESLSKNINTQNNNIDLFLPGEREQMIREYNQSSYFKYEPGSVIKFFQEKADRYPEKPAFLYGGNTMTYGEVNDKANKIAKALLELSKGENHVVGIMLDRSPQLVISLLGVLKSGCAYVPIDSGYPDERVQFILKDASICQVITSSDYASRFPDAICVHIPEQIMCTYPYTGNPGVLPAPYALAYIEYTSGSTGQPKGVMIEHHSLLNTLLDLERRFPVEADDVYLFKTTFSFDVSATEIYGWFMGEGALLFLEADGEKNPEKILNTIHDYGVTHINFVPSMFRMFLELFEEKKNIEKLNSLKWIFVGGEALTPDIVSKFNSLNTAINLENVYGPTECTIWASHCSLKDWKPGETISIGNPLNEIRWYVVDENKEILPAGIPGELCLSGAGTARGYLNRDDITKEKFCINPFFEKDKDPGHFERMYRTGDLVRRKPDGSIEFMGRIDFQVKMNGIRLELGEIENALSGMEGITQTVVLTKNIPGKATVLCAYYSGKTQIDTVAIREFLLKKIPSYMLPSFFVYKEQLPLNGSGKVDQKVLRADQSYLKQYSESYIPPETEMEKLVADIWKKVLSVAQVGLDEPFFEKGGHSVALMEVHNEMKKRLKKDISIVQLFQLPTIRLQAEYLSGEPCKETVDTDQRQESGIRTAEKDIAIIGMSVHVPGADSVKEFWDILENGRESIHFYKDDELRALGIPEDLIQAPNYIKVKGRVNGIEFFDPKFFKYTPADIKMMPPQLRLLYKGAWEAFEDAGYYPGSDPSTIGVFVGGSDDFEWYQDSILNENDFGDRYQAFTFGTNHFLATRLAYKLNIRGPVYTALTGCSTSLVTSHLACQSLISGECDMALAGGVTVELPNEGGYLYEEGMMFSPDGHLYPFDDRAKGTVFSNGMGLVVLKRLSDAVRDKDHIYAVIKGSAINNDGDRKIGFAAPSVEGQVDVMSTAYRRSGIDPKTVTYVEAHGTGTALGDPIEVESLTRIFGGDRRESCTLGSVKGNVGHADSAAGTVGLEKAALSLYHKYLPGTVNFEIPNRKINFKASPFVVKNHGEKWKETAGPRRAGINSFGIGGTNAHMILEEAPFIAESGKKEKHTLMVFSGNSEYSVDRTAERIVNYLLENESESVSISDAAWTLQVGRKEFTYRKTLTIGSDYKASPQKLLTALGQACVQMSGRERKEIYFMFPGQGSQYQKMGTDIYMSAADSGIGKIYSGYVDEILTYLGGEEDEYRDIMFGNDGPERIHQTKYSQMALFTVEYAMAKTLIELGVCPKGLIGHSIGEVVAAAVAGVWTLEDAVGIVKARGVIMQMQEPGIMTAVMADSESVKRTLVTGTWLSLRNTTGKCVVGGYREGIEIFEQKARELGWETIRIKTSHAFHTPMMDRAAREFETVLASCRMKDPSIPILSNLTGDWIRPDEMLNPSYWKKHITHPVAFELGLSQLLKDENGIFLEVGAGRTLCTFAMQHQSRGSGQNFINLIRHSREKKNDLEYILDKIGDLWKIGVKINWKAMQKGFVRRRVSLPTYVFDEMQFSLEHTGTRKTKTSRAAERKPEKASVETGNCPTDACREFHTLEKTSVNLSEEVKQAYGAIFGYETVGGDENFFDLGGDSLRGVSLAAVIRNELGFQVNVTDIFNAPTPKTLAALLEERRKEEGGNGNIQKADRRDYYPLSSAQNRMFALYQMDTQNTAYNLPSATMIIGKPDKARLNCALKKLVERHESLRTSFEIRQGQAVQVIHENLPISFTYENTVGSKQDISRLISDFVRPFDLGQAPLFRGTLIELEEEKHLLLFDFHHIIADGTSVEILSRDFGHLYEGELEPVETQYRDYAVWQQENLNSDENGAQKDYWMKCLSGEIPVLELPLDFERPGIKSFKGSRIHFKLERKLCERVSALAHYARATNYMTMLSAWYTLLARYSGQEDIIIGTPTAGRNRKEIRETVGMFVNMLAMRNYPAQNKTFMEFLEEVRDNSLNAYKNQEYQFDRLTNQLNRKWELNRNALFDVCFDYQNMEFHKLVINGLTFSPFDFDTGTTSYDLVLTCQENQQSEIDCFLDYSTALFCKDTIIRLISHYIKILETVTKNPEVCLKNINLMTKDEWDFLEANTNHTALSVEDPPVLQAMFEGQAQLNPDKIALITADGVELTYRELNEAANSLAWKLIDAGIGKEELVGIMPARDQYLFVAILGILKAGAAYVPIDPGFPRERVAYMLENGKISTLIVPERYKKNIGFQGTGIDLSTMKKDERAYINPVQRASLSSLACVVYTSGSTGTPKGVMINQESMVNFVMDVRNRKIFESEEDRVICLTTVSFDIFGFESVTPLCIGNSIYLADETEQLDPALAGEKIRRYQVTHLLSTVSRIKAFVDNPGFECALMSLRCILSGGENYPLELLKDLRQRSHARIFNMYGPTESTIWSTAKELTGEDAVNIGVPIANTKVYILNDAKQFQPVGVFGELCLAGKGLARGYWRRPEETADKFILIPGTNILVYRTGDRARILHTGEIELMGRLDSQIKIRGYRIEIGEIEKMAQHRQEIGQAAVVVYEDGNQNKQLAMFYRLKRKDPELKKNSFWLKTWLEERLPAYMVPSRLIAMDQMPCLPNGKLDKNALSAMVNKVLSEEVSVRKESGPVEMHLEERNFMKDLQKIWQEVLALETVGIRDNFFDIGGNSLGLILVNNKLSRLLGQSIPLMKLFENPTIESLAKSLGFCDEDEIVILKESEEEKTEDIAVIGMSCRFPGAVDIDEFWKNIVTGKESITELSDEELLASGIDEALFNNPAYVKKKGLLEGAEYFDGEFFQYTQKEADKLDPQMRLLHQCAFHALENGGYDSFRYQGKIGLFAGSSSNVMWMAKDLNSKSDLLDAFETMTLNEKDFLTTKISYKLNLTGPSMNIQTACSTSLAAIHQAVQSILQGESDMALAGGVSVTYPRKEGYLWQEGMIFSKDGHCRPFSHHATGTVSGNGCGLVLLKSLRRAEMDRDTIYAVIKGSSINNDGMEKIGYTAPGIAGQSQVIEDALKNAAVSPEDILYLEAHGTGTKLGDPIEVEALRQAFHTGRKNYCALGSVKANIGHLDAAAGVAGFIKAVLAVYNRTIPPLINFDGPNPRLNIEDSPFYVTTKAKALTDAAQPMNVGVSSFGIGGTNVHMVIGEGPGMKRKIVDEGVHTLVFSARSPHALEQAKTGFIMHMKEKEEISLSAAAWTLQQGRGEFEYRSVLIVRGKSLDVYSSEVREFLADRGRRAAEKTLPLVFSFTGEEDAAFLPAMNSFEGSSCLADNYNTIRERAETRFLTEGGTRAYAAEYAVWMLLEDMGLKAEGIICPGRKQSLFVMQYQADGRSRKIFVGSNDSEMRQVFPGGYLIVHIGSVQEERKRGFDEIFLGEKDKNCKDVRWYFHTAAGKLWMQGYSIRWKELLDGVEPPRIHLPGYVFDKKYHESDVSLNQLFGWKQTIPESKVIREEIKKATYEDVKKEVKIIWQEVLGCGEPEAEQDFFEAGGHSLTAISLTAKVKERLGVEIMLSDMFEHSALDQLSRLIFESGNKAVKQEIPSVPKQDAYETSSAQKRMFAVSGMSDSSVAYNLAGVYAVKGDLDKQRWTRAFQAVTDRHESFRTRFKLQDNELVQVIEEDVKADLHFIHIKEEDLKRVLETFVRPFDLGKAPLMRGMIVTVRPEYHIFAIDMHHIISDQSSVAILLKEFETFYQGGNLVPLKVQFKDFACWQNKFLKSPEAARQIDYWKKELVSEIPISELRTDFNRDRHRTKTAATLTFPFGADLSRQIKGTASEQGVTPYMLLLASLKLVLWKLTGVRHHRIGTGIAGRRHSDLEPIVGMFVNTLVISSETDPDSSAGNYLQYIKQKMVGAYDNQDCQLEILLDHLNIKTDPDRTPLFDIMFNYVNMGTDELKLNGLILEPMAVERAEPKFDITCTIVEHEGSFTAEFEYDKGLYCSNTIETLGSRLQLAASEISRKTDHPLHSLSIMTDKEKERLIYEMNHTATDAPLDKSLMDIFDEMVKKYREKTAVVWQGEEISYKKLNWMANAIAARLREAGFGYRDRAALILDRSPVQIAALIGVQKCGGIYIPIDPDYPENRINYILQDSGCSLIAASQMNYDNLHTSVKGVILEDDMFRDGIAPVDFERCYQNGEDRVYIIYTSGSTGNPKGTLLCHKNVMRVAVNVNYVDITPDDHVMQLSNYAFDGSVFDIFGALLNGAALYLVPKKTAVDMELLPQFIRENQITISFMTTALFHVLVDWDISALKSFKTLIVGGEVLSPSHMKKALGYMGPGHLINAYGPTETAVFACCYPLGLEDLKTESVPIGFPISNTTVYVLDQEMQPVPPGVAGELYIGGAGVGEGYLNQEKLTAEKYLRLPNMKDRVYRTGDKVMYREDGALIFLGRMDFQVKIRGFRVELEEIEKQIRKTEGIGDVIVKDWKDSSGSMYLAAYVVAEDGMCLEVQQCRLRLLGELPDYMVPSRWKQMDKLPLTSNGKVDRKALPLIENEKTALDEENKPRSKTEQIILEQMRKVLEQPGMGVSDDFFDKGGQSIKAIALVQALSKAGYRIKVSEIFQNPTARKLSRLPKARSKDGEYIKEEEPQKEEKVSLLYGQDAAQIKFLLSHVMDKNRLLSDQLLSSRIKKHFKTSPIQRLHASLGSDFSGFTDEIHGALTEQDMKEIIWSLIKENQLLHSGMNEQAEEAWEEYHVDVQEHMVLGNLPYLDMSLYENEAKQNLIRQLQKKLLMTPYKKSGVLWRVCCLKLSENIHYIIWGFDHTAFDGMSGEIIRTQIERKADQRLSLPGLLTGQEQVPQTYDSYVKLLEKGPERISEVELIENFSMKKWNRYNDAVLAHLSVIPERTVSKLLIKIPFLQEPDTDPWWYSFNFIQRLLRDYTGQSEIPLGILDYGRGYGTDGFYNCVGEFLDIIPVILKQDIAEEDITKKLSLCADHAINFISLLNDQELSRTYHEVSKLLNTAYSTVNETLNMILFNFQGFVSNREKQAFKDLREPGNQNARLMITVNYNDECLNIELECTDGLNQDMISELVGRYSSICPGVSLAC